MDEYERGISLSGMSKAFGMPGIRIGWLAVRDPALMRSLQRLHDYSTICSSAPSEVCLELGQGLSWMSSWCVLQKPEQLTWYAWLCHGNLECRYLGKLH